MLDAADTGVNTGKVPPPPPLPQPQSLPSSMGMGSRL